MTLSHHSLFEGCRDYEPNPSFFSGEDYGKELNLDFSFSSDNVFVLKCYGIANLSGSFDDWLYEFDHQITCIIYQMGIDPTIDFFRSGYRQESEYLYFEFNFNQFIDSSHPYGVFDILKMQIQSNLFYFSLTIDELLSSYPDLFQNIPVVSRIGHGIKSRSPIKVSNTRFRLVGYKRIPKYPAISFDGLKYCGIEPGKGLCNHEIFSMVETWTWRSSYVVI